MGVPIVQVLFGVMLFLDLEVGDQFLPLPFPNLGLAGSLKGVHLPLHHHGVRPS